MEFTLLWAALTAVVSIWIAARIWKDRLPKHTTDRVVGAAALGMLAGRLVAMVLQGVNPLTNPGDILLVRGGVHTGAATLGAIAAFLWSGKGNVRDLDPAAPVALIGLAGWQAGCLWRGGCLGTASSLPWAWSEAGSSITRHPTELYAAMGMLAAAWLVHRLPERLLLRAGSALALAALVRLLSEPVRLSLTGGPWTWYLAGIVLGGLVAWQGDRLVGRRVSPPT
ncbi:MAG: prolipoprotein diacylglyceryl transferase family protein [Acidimicrobiia bacterium]